MVHFDCLGCEFTVVPRNAKALSVVQYITGKLHPYRRDLVDDQADRLLLTHQVLCDGPQSFVLNCDRVSRPRELCSDILASTKKTLAATYALPCVVICFRMLAGSIRAKCFTDLELLKQHIRGEGFPVPDNCEPTETADGCSLDKQVTT